MPYSGDLLGDRYRLDDRIAAGGMGEVWRATDTVLGRPVAVKTLLAGYAGDAGFRTRFHHEARAMASLRHGGVAPVYDFGETGEGAYLVMARVDGVPLNQWIAEHGPLTAAETLSIVARGARALAAAHAAGIVHRDVKPGNLIIEPDGNVVLVDFGVARSTQSVTLTGAREVVGTALYIAPEQVSKKATGPAADLYALGAVAYHCLAGRPPFLGDNPVAVALQHLDQEPPPLPASVPGPVRDLVATAMAKDPAERFPSALAMAEAAEAASASLHVSPATGATNAPAAGVPIAAADGSRISPAAGAPITAAEGGAIAAGAIGATGSTFAASPGSPPGAEGLPTAADAAPIAAAAGAMAGGAASSDPAAGNGTSARHGAALGTGDATGDAAGYGAATGVGAGAGPDAGAGAGASPGAGVGTSAGVGAGLGAGVEPAAEAATHATPSPTTGAGTGEKGKAPNAGTGTRPAAGNEPRFAIGTAAAAAHEPAHPTTEPDVTAPLAPAGSQRVADTQVWVDSPVTVSRNNSPGRRRVAAFGALLLTLVGLGTSLTLINPFDRSEAPAPVTSIPASEAPKQAPTPANKPKKTKNNAVTSNNSEDDDEAEPTSDRTRTTDPTTKPAEPTTTAPAEEPTTTAPTREPESTTTPPTPEASEGDE
ncbi:serine/threonine-protein kinase [Actinoplanes aureus]|uniref:serine/threonine-protein kinase n=1 Tax=Actinoplanes aureus TaxID=2792083 RepID=UPI001E5AF889|nr:serine/threonine-protein kinase [Actinoplanes aureus]